MGSVKIKVTAITLAIFLSAAGGIQAEEIVSIQLVGNFNGITCDPADPANEMVNTAPHVWRKLKFINEPFDPDTISFKFTKNDSFSPGNWGWSGEWGIAEWGYDPPNIIRVLPDSGYYYFQFNDSTYHYRLDRPGGVVSGYVTAENFTSGVPAGTVVSLHHPEENLIGNYIDFYDSTFSFQHLPPSTYSLSATAPGYRDTTITGIVPVEDETTNIHIHLRQVTAVRISRASCDRIDKDVIIRWTTVRNGGETAFDIYRGTNPVFKETAKINNAPVRSTVSYEYVDRDNDPAQDYCYYLVERDGEGSFRYGPLEVSGMNTPMVASSLGQNYPNPFNPATNIPYSVGSEDRNNNIAVSFFDVSGRMVERYNLGRKAPGEYIFHWNPFSPGNEKLTSGVYYCRLNVGKKVFTRKMILLR